MPTMWNVQANCRLNIYFQKSDYDSGGNWFILGTKHRDDNQ